MGDGQTCSKTLNVNFIVSRFKTFKNQLKQCRADEVLFANASATKTKEAG